MAPTHHWLLDVAETTVPQPGVVGDANYGLGERNMMSSSPKASTWHGECDTSSVTLAATVFYNTSTVYLIRMTKLITCLRDPKSLLEFEVFKFMTSSIQIGVTAIPGRSSWHLPHVTTKEVSERTRGCSIARSDTARRRFDLSQAPYQDFGSEGSCH
jgi:hypothetical protein